MIVNGNEMKVDSSITIIDLLDKFNLSTDKVVVEVNFQIISKGDYSQYILNEEDKIEILV